MRLRKGAILALTLAAVAVFAATLIRAVWYAPESEIAPPFTPVVAPTSSEPLRLSIPKLNIDAQVEKVGINGKGEMGVPSTFKTVGWYKYGPPPGQLGSAVIDGHVDNALALPGVFKHLGDLSVGDSVYIVARDGNTLRFVVDEIAQYPFDASPKEKIFSQTDAARLTLITCSGTWMKGKQMYSDRLVIYTKFVGVVSGTI